MEKNRNAGFTLVELLVAMLMSLIIIGGVGQFMVAASNNYQAVDRQTNLQMEAQSVINSISDMVLESNNVALLKKDSQQYFVIYYDKKRNVVWLDGEEHKLYLFACENNAECNDVVLNGNHSKKMLFAEGVYSMDFFDASPGKSASNKLGEKGLTLTTSQRRPLVRIEMKLCSKITAQSKNEEGFTYIVSDTVAPRNEIVPIS